MKGMYKHVTSIITNSINETFLSFYMSDMCFYLH